MLSLLYRLHIFASDQIKEERNKKKSFYFFLATFEQLLTFFWATFEQLFEKFRATFREISSNLWQALSSIDLPNGTSNTATS